MKNIIIILLLPFVCSAQMNGGGVFWAKSSESVNGLLTGLVSYYKMDETSGTTMTDEEIVKNGTLSGGTTVNVTGIMGKAYDFDGANDYVTIPHHSAINFNGNTDSYSIQIWVKSADPAIGSSHVRLMEKRLGGAGRYPISFLVLYTTEQFWGVIYDGSNVPHADITDPFDNTWHHIVWVVDNQNDNIKSYLDGVLKHTVTNTTTLSTANTGALRVGCNGAVTAGTFYDGILDELGIWDRVLDADDITELYNSGSGLNYDNFD